MAGSVTVETTAGRVLGRTTASGVHELRGIPYGEAPVGDRRFLPPVAKQPWTGTLEAVRRPNQSPQVYGMGGVRDRLMSGGNTEPYDEDCLGLSVWSRGLGDGGRRPVMVYIHGGGYTGSSSNRPLYDGDGLAKRGDVVTVTLNHRLGAVGYLHLAEIGGERFESSGAAGLLDLVLALEWVRDNAEAFGGDPGNVTILGQSGGGGKVSMLMGMPAARGLFHRAIVQSGPGLRGAEPDAGTALARRAMTRLGLADDDVAGLQRVPWQDLVAAVPPGVGGVRPVVGSTALPTHPFDPVAAPTAAGVPLLIGACQDEGTWFAGPVTGQGADAARAQALAMAEAMAPGVVDAYRSMRPGADDLDLALAAISDNFRVGSIRQAERHAATGTPVFMYHFTYDADVEGLGLGATHGAELPFTLNHPETPLAGKRADRDQLLAMVCDAWLAFSRTGDPNHPGLARWPAYEADRRATMLLDVPSTVVDDPAADVRRAWESAAAGI